MTYVLDLDNDEYYKRVVFHELLFKKDLGFDNEERYALYHKISGDAKSISFRTFIDSDDIFNAVKRETETFLMSWDNDLNKIFDTIEEAETTIVQQYTEMLNQKFSNITDKTPIVTAFKNMIGIVENGQEYRNRFKPYVDTIQNIDQTVDTYHFGRTMKSHIGDAIIQEDVFFYIRVILHHTWGYVSTHVNGDGEYTDRMFAMALSYNNTYFRTAFNAYIKNNPTKKFNPTDQLRKDYLIGFFTQESEKYADTITGIDSTISLKQKRIDHITYILLKYEEVVISNKYKYWEELLIKAHEKRQELSSDEAYFLCTITTKERYLFQQIYAIKYLYSLITQGIVSRVFTGVKGAATSVGSKLSSTTTGIGSRLSSAATGFGSRFLGTKPVVPVQSPANTGGKRTRSNRRKSATIRRRIDRSVHRKRHTMRRIQHRRWFR